MFCRFAHLPGERHNGAGRSRKDEYWAGVHQFEEQTYRDEHEQKAQGLNSKASQVHAMSSVVLL
jgi:hypothetical protein